MRMRPLADDEFDPSLRPVLDDILRLRGSVYNLHRVLAHSPKGLRAFMGFSEYLRDNADLEPRLRELATLRVSTLHDVAYEIAQHQAPARRAGLTAEQIAAVADWHTHADLFDARERAVLAYAEESASNGFRVSDETFAALREQLGDHEIVDLSLVVGWYLLCAAVLVPLEIEIEPELRITTTELTAADTADAESTETK